MNKIFNKRTLIIFIIEMMMTVIYLFIKGFDTIVNYCNAFFVSGFAIICIGGLSWLSNIGTFDIFGYSWKTLKSSFSKDVKRDYNSMYEYSESKRAQRDGEKYNFLSYILVGGVAFIVAIVIRLFI